MTIEGNEIASITAATTNGIFHSGISANFENTTPAAVAREPRATPRAATVPVSSFFGPAGADKSKPAGPKKLDTGTVAALGVALGSLDTAAGGVFSQLDDIPLWKLPVGVGV